MFAVTGNNDHLRWSGHLIWWLPAMQEVYFFTTNWISVFGQTFGDQGSPE